MKPANYDRFWGLLLVASVVFAFAYGVYSEWQLTQPETPSQQAEAYKPKLYTVITREGTHKNLKRAGSGDYETPDGKTIHFYEPYTEFEQ